MFVTAEKELQLAERVQKIGFGFLRWGLIVSAGWIAAMKPTEVEAKGIEPLIAHSPFMSWMLNVMSVRHASDAIGIIEGIVLLLIALRPWSPKACVIGSIGAVLTFMTTLSFMLEGAAWDSSLGGFPALSAIPGEFVIKDLVLLGASLWSLGESLAAVARQNEVALYGAAPIARSA